MNLDERVAQKRGEVFAKQSLDVEWFDDSVSIYTIYSAIEKEAKTLNTAGGRYKTDQSADALERMRGIDERLKKIWFYRVCVRGILKKMYEKRKKAEFQDSEDGVRFQREFVRRFTKDFRIPILGRIFRGINNFFHVNRNITGLIGWNQELENRVKNMEDQAENMRNRVKNMEDQAENMRNRVKNMEDQAEDMRNRVKNMEDRAENMEDRIEDIENRIEEIHAWRLSERADLMERNLQDHNNLIDKHEKILGTELKEVQELIQTVVVELSNMKAEFTSMHQVPERSIQRQEMKEISSIVSEVQSNDYLSIDYFDFENRFRGSRKDIKNSQRIYVPYFENRNNVVDLGCGRGEFVELMMEHGVGVRGIDLYAPFVEYCKMLHLPVEQQDMIQFLRQQDSVDGIFLGQVVEHITIEQIIELCMLAYEKLQPGCYLIMETQNPRSLAIYTNAFWIDPSHKKPVHPLTLQYIAEKQGFSDVQILYTESSRLPDEIPRLSDKEEGREHEFDVAMQQVSNLLYGSQDYALIARK